MSTHIMDRRTPAPGYPEATSVGDHLVIDKTEWVPGPDPQPHRRDPDQDAYPESFLYCLRCGVEALALRDLPATCEADLEEREEPGDGDESGDRDESSDPDRTTQTVPNVTESTDPDGRAD